MSGTDKTRPWWVRMKEDRLAFDSVDAMGKSWRCPKWWVGEARCGCRMCTAQDFRRQENRKQRREGKKIARCEQMESR